MFKTILALTLILCPLNLVDAKEKKLLDNDDQRIVFIGDSNTHAGQYISLIEAQLLRNGNTIELVNLGLPSEGVTGLSEPDHPFPRPNVHDRLEAILEKTEPDLVVSFYGINDGIYYPFSDDRFEKFQEGINELTRLVRKADAKHLMLAAPMFDALPMKKNGKLLAEGAEKYAWFAIYENYDDVMKKYAKWQFEADLDIDGFIHTHRVMKNYFLTKRKDNPGFVMSGDGVHINLEGHALIAKFVTNKLGYQYTEVPQDVFNAINAKQKLKSYYGNMNERQFRNVFRKALQKRGNTTENFIGLLERRLDTVIYRAKFAITVFAARQLINHGHVKVNGKKVNISSFLVTEKDSIEIKDKSKELLVIEGSLVSKEREIPDYIQMDEKNRIAKLIRVPKFSEVPYPTIMEPNLVVEYYSR